MKRQPKKPVSNRRRKKETADEPALGLFDEAVALVDKQAKDYGLWFDAQTASEAYLQQELRKLHATIERCAIRTGRYVVFV